MQSTREIETAYAAFARDYTLAAKELNPYADCDVLDLGTGVAVYSGAFSPIHGVYAAGLDGPLEDRDFAEIEKFFEKAERAAVWHTAGKADAPIMSETITVFELKGQTLAFPPLPEITVPQDHHDWLLAHTRSRKGNPAAAEPDLFSSVVLHMKNTRLYLHPNHTDAAFTHFSHGGALTLSRPGLQPETLLTQIQAASEYGAHWIALLDSAKLPEIINNFSHWQYSHQGTLRGARKK